MGKINLKTIIVIAIVVVMMLSVIPINIMLNAKTYSENIIQPDVSNVKTLYINSTFVINSSTIDPLTGLKGSYGFDANVIIGSTGNLSVLNANLYFIQDYLNPVSLQILPGGTLYLYNSTLTVTPDRYYPSLNFTLNDNGGGIYSVNSKLMFPGWLNVSNANLYFYGTTFSNVTAGEINTIDHFGFPSSDNIYLEYGPTPVFSGDTIIMKNVKFEKLKQTPPDIIYAAYGVPNTRFPVQVTTASKTIANGYTISPSNIYQYTTFYNGTVELNYSTSSGYSNNSMVNIYYRNIFLNSLLLPGSVKATNVNVSISFNNIPYLVNSRALESSNNLVLNITAPSSGSVTINSIKLRLYTDSSLLTQTGFYMHQFNMIGSTLYGQNVFISANSNYSNGNSQKNYIFLQNSRAYILNLTVSSGSASSGYFDPPYLMDQSSSIYIYRYALIKVENYNGVALSNLSVIPTPDDLQVIYNGNTVMDNEIVNNLNTLLYSELNIAPTQTNRTGVATLPLFTDLLSMSYWPNSLYGGNYLVNITSGNTLLKSTTIGLPYFPNLNLSGNDYKIIETVIVPDIIVESLSVPQMMIHNETYELSSEITVFGKSISNVPVSVSMPGFSKIYYVNLVENSQYYLNISYTVPGTVVPGNYSVNVTANPYRTIYESNYSNDYKSVYVTIYPDTDLGVSKPVFSPIVLYSKEFVNFTVFNTGSDGAKNVNVSLLLQLPNGTYLSDSWIINIPGHSSIPISYLFVPENIGTYAAIVRAPYYWDINPSNNINFNSTYSQIIYQFNPSNTGFKLLKNITQGQPMDIELYAQISVKGVIPSLAPNVTVSFYDLTNGVLIGTNQTYYSGGFLYSNLTTSYFYYGHKYLVGLVLANPYENVTYIAYEYYNFTLYIPGISYSIDPIQNQYMNGTTVPIYINITIGSTAIDNLTVGIEFTTLGIVHTWYFNTTKPYENISLLYYFSTSSVKLNGLNSLSVPYIIYLTFPEIYPHSLILYQSQITVVEKPNLNIQTFTYKTNSYVSNINQVPLGTYFEVLITVVNNGGSTANGNATLILMNDGKEVLEKNITNLAPGNEFNVVENITAENMGSNNLTLFVNYTALPQKYPGPKESVITFNVIPPATQVIMYSSSNTPTSGEKISLTFLVLNVNATQQEGRNVFMQNILLTVIIKGSSGAGSSYSVPIGPSGYGVLTFTPQNSGSYSILVEYSVGNQFRSQIVSSMNIQGQGIGIPLWLIAIIVVVIIVVGIFGYSYMKFKKVEKNLMVCGNCGSLIPADSEKCPVCGVVFEKENVKCGNCGSWIKKDAKYCPVCGTLYMDENDPDYQKYSKLRDEYYLDIQKFREEAKRDLGDKFTDEEFYRWWNSKPEFITFEKWMERKEEEKNPTVECPVCGTLNPKGSKFCKVCGSPLPGAEEEKK